MQHPDLLKNPSPILDPHKPPRKHILCSTLSQNGARHSCHDRANVLLTLRTRRAPVQPARPTACSQQVKTSHAAGVPENSRLVLSSSASGCAWQPPPDRSNHIPKKDTAPSLPPSW